MGLTKYMRAYQDSPSMIQLFTERKTVGFVSPGGQVIQRLPLNIGAETLVTFTLENTQIFVHYGNSNWDPAANL